MGVAGALAGLLGGAAITALGAVGLRQGLVAALGVWPRVAATAAPLALSTPIFAFSAWAARDGLAGAALGAAAGGFVGIALTAAVLAWSGARETARRASTLSACSVLAAAAVVVTAFDGKVTQPEGRLMLLASIAIILVSWRSRAEAPALGAEPGDRRPLRGGLVALLGAIAVTLGAFWAAGAVAPLAGRRADGDLELGLSVLGLAGAAPSIFVAWRAARRGEGGAAFVEVATAGALGLAGAVGTSALILSLSISEAFLDAPLLGLCLAGGVFVALAALRPRQVRGLRPVAGVVYLALLAAFARSAG